ncbi:MAG: RagB/SusD family nutrient uptake outer membrane protein [Carboxylicivirga sp.]|jgi:hypothetical protein|nr:RagB/SusD family nutrient uptake outer membrane protein [Carboxylicivirga sp.]
MKTKIILLLSLLFLGLGSQSCSDFLDVKPRNKRIVKTPSDHKAILAGYMRFLNDQYMGNAGAIKSLFHFDSSDRLTVYCGESNYVENYIADPETGEFKPNVYTVLNWMEKNTQKWQANYKFTGYLNYIIDNIDEVKDDIEISTEDNYHTRNYVKGEALVWRAWAYYNLIQYYSPYKNNDLGIVLNTDIYEDPINANIERSTQSESYKQVFSDIRNALELLDKTPTTPWNVIYNEEFINCLLANIYFYKAMSGAKESDDWANAEKYARLAIGDRVLSENPESLEKMFDMGDSGYKVYDNSQFTLRIVKTSNSLGNFASNRYRGGSLVDAKTPLGVYNLYKSNDIRRDLYFMETPSGLIVNDKYNLHTATHKKEGSIYVPYRLADNFLILAEALVRQNKINEGWEVLNSFKEKRYIEYDVSNTPSSGDELLNDILLERRLEFFHECDVRWLEMKRLGYRFDRGVILGHEIVLEEDDFRYTWPIPILEFEDEESKIVQNPGWEDIMRVE